MNDTPPLVFPCCHSAYAAHTSMHYSATEAKVFLVAKPNARLHLLPEAAATQERRLEAVRCKPWFGTGFGTDAGHALLRWAGSRQGNRPRPLITVRVVAPLKEVHPEIGSPVRFEQTLAALKGLLEGRR